VALHSAELPTQVAVVLVHILQLAPELAKLDLVQVVRVLLYYDM
jgi:hypothetical protein